MTYVYTCGWTILSYKKDYITNRAIAQGPHVPNYVHTYTYMDTYLYTYIYIYMYTEKRGQHAMADTQSCRARNTQPPISPYIYAYIVACACACAYMHICACMVPISVT